MPKSRKLLAVPFVGKDVPSRASEFSHPDVVIGESSGGGGFLECVSGGNSHDRTSSDTADV